MKSLASSSIATHLVLGVHQLSSSMAQISSFLNSAHLKLLTVSFIIIYPNLSISSLQGQLFHTLTTQLANYTLCSIYIATCTGYDGR